MRDVQFEVNSEPSEFRWIKRSTNMNESSGRNQVAKINREQDLNYGSFGHEFEFLSTEALRFHLDYVIISAYI